MDSTGLHPNLFLERTIYESRVRVRVIIRVRVRVQKVLRKCFKISFFGKFPRFFIGRVHWTPVDFW
jgi:hypothetical protein